MTATITPTRLALAHNSAGDWVVLTTVDDNTMPKVLWKWQRAFTVVCFGSHQRAGAFAAMADELNDKQRKGAA